MKQETLLTVRDYLEASTDASKRTRTIMVSIVIASILMFAGFLNSLGQDWMLQRVQAASVPKSEYVHQKFPQWDINSPEFEKKREGFYEALLEAYVNNTFTIRVPFFGITFDVNDLGLVGGVAVIVLLILFRFSLSRELDNLELSFMQAKISGELPTFYNLLAMRQVLTVPPSEGKKDAILVRAIPKILSFLPLFVLTVVIAHDFLTYDIGSAINLSHTIGIYIGISALWAFALVVSISCLLVWLKIDSTWQKYWGFISHT